MSTLTNQSNQTSQSTSDSGRYVLYEASLNMLPELVGTFNSLDVAIEIANKVVCSTTTAYLFDGELGRPTRSRSLIYACSPTWRLTTDDELNRIIIANRESSYVNWHGSLNRGFVATKLYRGWSQEEADEVDFLNIDASSLRQPYLREHPERVNAHLIADELNRVCTSYGVGPNESPKNSFERMSAQEIGEEFGRFDNAYRTMCLELLKALPPENLFDSEHIKNPMTDFTNKVRSGKFDKLDDDEYEALRRTMDGLSRVWNHQETIPLGELAWRAIAMRNSGVDLVAHIARASESLKASADKQAA